MIALCAIMRGADSWTQMAACGRVRLDWFQEFLQLPPASPPTTPADVFSLG